MGENHREFFPNKYHPWVNKFQHKRSVDHSQNTILWTSGLWQLTK